MNNTAETKRLSIGVPVNKVASESNPQAQDKPPQPKPDKA